MAEGPRSAHSDLPFAVKPGTPQIFSHVDIAKEATLEATVQWAPPVWPPHKVLICQFQYKKCQAQEWTQVSAQASFPPYLQGMGQHPESYSAQPHLAPVMESPQVPHRRPHRQLCSFVSCFLRKSGYVARLVSKP